GRAAGPAAARSRSPRRRASPPLNPRTADAARRDSVASKPKGWKELDVDRLLRYALVLALAVGLVGIAAAQGDYPWKPERPINIIVPWAAGGSTDQVVR